MKKTIRAIILFSMLLAAMLLATSCAKTPTRYETYDAEGYSVSVKYDANGGTFTTNVETIVDTYNLSNLPTNTNGMKELALISPDDAVRGTGNAFPATKPGYFLAGWYQSRTPVTNAAGEALDEEGNVASVSGKTPAYTYSDRWDFQNGRKEIDANGAYSAATPVLTLYAAWIPRFEYAFYALDTGEKLGAYSIDPTTAENKLTLPSWVDGEVKIQMNQIPTVAGKTWEAAYLDAAGTQPVEGTEVLHTGTYDLQNATAQNSVMKLYLQYKDGEWFHIYNAKQFVDNISVNGCYEIMADIDFATEGWPSSFRHGIFGGQIIGNGKTFSNITIEQTDGRKQNTGVFGTLSANSVIKDLTLSEVTVKIEKGSTLQDAKFGLLAGTIESAATLENVQITNSTLEIRAQLLEDGMITAETEIGVLCGAGAGEIISTIDPSGISCTLSGDGADAYTITTNGNEILFAPRSNP